MNKLRVLFRISLLLFPAACAAQQLNLPLNRTWMLESEARLIGRKSDTARSVWDTTLHRQRTVFTAVRPLIEGEAINIHTYRADNSFVLNTGYHVLHTRDRGNMPAKNWKWLDRMYSHGIIFLDVPTEEEHPTDRFTLEVDPLFGLESGRDFSSDSTGHLRQNTRGVRAMGRINKKISFETTFWENQARFVQYIADFNEKYFVVPGQGRWKRFKADGYDYAMASGYLSYSPLKNTYDRKFALNFQVGHGKQFIGDGYRSLLLSDNSFDYPYARTTVQYGQVQYAIIYASLMNLVPGGEQIPAGTERLFEKKAASFSVLSWKPFRQAEIGLFQGLIWEAADSVNRQHVDFNFYNPIIFSSLPKYGLHDANHNYLLGLTWRVDILRRGSFYGQFMMDDYSSNANSIHNKTGLQAGLKYFNVAGIKHLHAQIEYNRVRPYSYAGMDNSQAYMHYAQALAHPLGANFTEWVFFANYRLRDFYGELRLSSAEQGGYKAGQNYGSDIFMSDSTAFGGSQNTVSVFGQGNKVKFLYREIKLGYTFDYATNLNVYIAWMQRERTVNGVKAPTNYLCFGLRTSLLNTYYDF